MKRICYFGIFNPEYIRNKVLILGFEANGYEVVQLAVDPSVGRIKKFVELYRLYKKLEDKEFDYVVVGFPGPTVVPLARLLFGRKIIFDAFMSQYDSVIIDRKEVHSWGIKGIRHWLTDWLSCFLAYRVLLAEHSYIKYFVETFGFEKKYIQVYTGANDEVFQPSPNATKDDVFTAHFHGNFIPLQGIEFIVDAANILRDENIKFQIIGGSGGEYYESIRKKIADLNLTNVDLIERKPLKEVLEWINRAHVCLGVFGDTPKTKRVISNKIYECIATGMPLITSRTPATNELFTDREHVLFADVADGKSIAERIMELKNDPVLQEHVAKGGYKLFSERLTPKRLVEGLLRKLDK